MTLLVRAAALVLLLATAPAAAAAADPRHREAEFAVAPADETPPATLPWRRVVLPDQWTGDAPAEGSAGWYRVTFEVSQPGGEPWLVYLPRLREGGTLFVNGRLLARVAEPDARTWVRWMRPHAFSIPPGELRPGTNTLHVRINPANQDRIISSVYVGPDALVRPRYESRHFLTYTLAQIISTVTLVVAGFIIAIWLRRRMEFDYGLFGLACLAWGVHTLNYMIETVPEDWWLAWRVVRYAATGGFAVAITLFYLRYAGLRFRGMTRAFGAYWISGPLLLAAGGAPAHELVDRYYQAGLLVLGGVMICAAVVAVWRQRTAMSFAFLVCGVLGLGGSVHDYLLSQGLVVDPEGHYMLYFAAAALLGVAGWQLADRFVGSLRAAEAAIRERERAVALERQRIMQDMHDGLGSQLLSSLAAVERGALDPQGMAQVLREAVDDMRLAIDTLAPEREGLLEALGNLRYRLEPRFRAAGITLRFARRGLPERLDVADEHALQILRVLQESLTNVLKHARARQVEVSMSVEGRPPSFILSIADDGSGFDTGSAGPGRGLSGMRRRAEQIGATLDVASGARGTRVVLAYPLPAA